jgi:hypothetical protein
MKKDKMNGACSTYGRDEKFIVDWVRVAQDKGPVMNMVMNLGVL